MLALTLLLAFLPWPAAKRAWCLVLGGLYFDADGPLARRQSIRRTRQGPHRLPMIRSHAHLDMPMLLARAAEDAGRGSDASAAWAFMSSVMSGGALRDPLG